MESGGNSNEIVGLEKRNYEERLKILWMIVLGREHFNRLIQCDFRRQYIDELVEMTEKKVWI